MRLDLINYVARGSPPLHPEAIRGYRPIDEAASAAVRGPADLISRFHDVLDDGHTIKVVRALLIAQELARKYADRNWIAIKSDDEWTRVHLMLMDSAGGQDPRWIYNSGFEEAWESMPKAKAIVQSKW
jgi:hypothetical protein